MRKGTLSACPASPVTAPPVLRTEPQERLGLRRVPHGATLAPFIEYLETIETPAMRAVRVMAKQIREQEA